MENPGNRIIVALDMGNLDSIKAILEKLQNEVSCFQIGLDILSRIGGPKAVSVIRDYGEVFYDGKFNDIPDTIREASRGVSSLGVKMFSVHASTGIEGMIAAREGNELGYCKTVTPQKSYSKISQILAVTVLTSLDDADTNLIFGAPSEPKVLEFARWAKLAGLDGIICSPQELKIIGGHEELSGLIKVTPGVRPDWAESGDQRRIMTPIEAIKAGADYLIIGRPITEPDNGMTPLDAVKRIKDEIAGALG